MEFNEMKECFKRCFAQYDNDDFSPPNEAKWIYAVVSPKRAKEDDALRGFHYELIARGSGAGEEYHIELHFELYKHQYSELRAALISKFAEKKNRRKIIATSHYSSLMWSVRTPIFDQDHIAKDVELLRTAVKEVLEKLAKTTYSVSNAFQDKAEEELVLPCHLPVATIASMLSEGYKAPCDHIKNSLTIPPVQRGKVWNAARIETLWDSIFRGFPIGALSVWHNKNSPHVYELLDGQQRATAITLGFEDFPNYANKFDSILWIDIEACSGDCGQQYSFFVTTASQPWGYAESSSETRNSLLSASERRNAANALNKWDENQIKPYPFQLYPVKARYPVPYTLLRQFAEENRNRTFADFRNWLKPRINKFLFQEILGDFIATEEAEENFRQLCKKVSDISKDYTVFLLDASSVTENDIALYFTRIGKGGVVPSDEELAYSVLKSKLTPEFRTVIQKIHEKYGLASESRIAHLAIRLFKSESSQRDSGRPHFDTSLAFSSVMGMCKEGNAQKKREFLDFITKDFGERVEKVNKKYALTQWHLARYASERNGDVFLLLLLAAGNEEMLGKSNYNVNGLAELLFGYATHIDYAMRKIFEQGVPIAIANLTRETYYGRPRLSLPIAPEKFENIPCDSIEALLKWKNGNPDVARSIAEGYYNSNYNHAYNILLYACRRSKINNQFKYDKNLGLWSEENLPWDYDHIMPHSTIEKMPVSDAKSVCEWLKNSMGNLAPLPFSLNRSWSDAARNENYPCGDSNGQVSLCIEDGINIASMWDSKGQIVPLNFCVNTITRYSMIYRSWFNDLNVGQILNFGEALDEKTTSNSEIWDAAKHRYSAFSKVESLLSGMSFTYKRIIADNKGQEIRDDELCREFCADQVITLSKDVNGVSVALSKCGIRGAWEIGLRKCSVDSATTKSTYEKVKATLPFSNIDNNRLCREGERWWYWYEELPDRIDGLESMLSDRLVVLIGFAEKLLERNK